MGIEGKFSFVYDVPFREVGSRSLVHPLSTTAISSSVGS